MTVKFLTQYFVKICISIAFFTTSVFATISPYESLTTSLGSFSLTYKPNSEQVTTTFDSKNFDSWWVVATDGAMPTKSVQLIGDVKRNIVTAYTYTGGGNNGFRTGTYLGTIRNAITSTGFSLDLSGINAAARRLGADGFEIGDKAGVWFSGGKYSDLRYSNNKITKYEACDFDTIVDYSNKTTTKKPTPVSEPFALLSLISAFGLYQARRRYMKAD